MSVGERRPHIHYHSDHSAFGGCETMLVNLFSQPAIRQAFDVTFSFRNSPRYASELQRRVTVDFPVYPMGFVEPSNLVPAVHAWPRPFAGLGRFVSRQLTTIPAFVHEVAALRRLFVRLRPDILHINNGGYPGALSARAAAVAGRLAGIPHILMVVNNHAEGYGGIGRKLQYPLDRMVVRAVSQFLSGSMAAANRLAVVLKLAPDRVRPILQGGDLRTPTETVAETRARLALGPDAGVVFGIVALFEARKGHHVLIEAMSRLEAARTAGDPPYVVLFLGDGPLRASLQALAEARGVAHRCRFLGFEGNPMNVINVLDALVLASIGYEDFPNVVLEAMGAGKAVIASRMAGTPEQVVEGETGLLVTPGSVDELANAMTRLLRDAALREAMGIAAQRRFTELFTAALSAERYATFYRELLAGTPGQG